MTGINAKATSTINTNYSCHIKAAELVYHAFRLVVCEYEYLHDRIKLLGYWNNKFWLDILFTWVFCLDKWFENSSNQSHLVYIMPLVINSLRVDTQTHATRHKSGLKSFIILCAHTVHRFCRPGWWSHIVHMWSLGIYWAYHYKISFMTLVKSYSLMSCDKCILITMCNLLSSQQRLKDFYNWVWKFHP